LWVGVEKKQEMFQQLEELEIGRGKEEWYIALLLAICLTISTTFANL
jgi:hypothetical protein